MSDKPGNVWNNLSKLPSDNSVSDTEGSRSLLSSAIKTVNICSDKLLDDKEMQPIISLKANEDVEMKETKAIDVKTENQYSRYNEEFEELEPLGKGGCGHVVKVFNTTDRQNYAVKRVELSPHEVEVNERLKREAELFARLKHDNIVRYFGAWIEKGVKRTPQSEIVWSTDSQEETEEEESAKKLSQGLHDSENANAEGVNHISYLYIQMELCERTLRKEIDDGLPNDKNRVTRYFCEILEGLIHIHQNQVIHRDLKPDNIFIDREDHIKIGDFGLATCSKGWDVNCSHSGNVGTSVYKAPEINSNNGTALYNQKVDMYSLGVVLLEMCYSFKTGMERAIVLKSLKKTPAELPNGLEEWQDRMIRLLVNHVVEDRPTANELWLSPLASNLSLHGANVPKVVSNVLSNRGSKEYSHLIDSCLRQKVESRDGVHYDFPKPAIDLKNQYWVEEVVKRIENIFQKHGATCLSTPLLHPLTAFMEPPEQTVCLMDKDGMVVNLPHNAKVSFARWVVWNQVTRLTRYATLPKYEERRSFSHPKRTFECVYDIISPSKVNCSPDAKILFVMWDIINSVSLQNNIQFLIFLNHTDLVKAALMAAGVQEENLQAALEIIGRKGVECIGSLQLKNGPIDISQLQTLLKITGTSLDMTKTNLLQKVPEKLHNMINMAINELVEIKRAAWLLGARATFYTTLKLVDNIHLFSGMLCGLVCSNRMAGRHHIVVDGGCYDSVLATHRATLSKVKPDIKTQSLSGITVYPDRLTKLMPRGVFEPQLVVLWATDGGFLEAGERVAESLRRAGIRCLTMYDVKLPSEDIAVFDNDWRVFCTVQVTNRGCIIKEKGRSSQYSFYSFGEAAVYILDIISKAFIRPNPSPSTNSLEPNCTPSFTPNSSHSILHASF